MALAYVLAVVSTTIVVVYLVFAVVHLGVIGIGAREFKRRSGIRPSRDGPPITMAVPAYNERETAVEAISALLDQEYPVSVAFVDDGSTDGTFEAVEAAFDLDATERSPTPPDVQQFEARDAALTVYRQDNRGKAAALNLALGACDTPLFGVVDADTIVGPDTLPRIVTPFEDEATVACEGSFRVGDPSRGAGRLPASWVERNQALEHLRALILRQLGRSRFDLMVHVFGAYSAFRTDLVRAVGGFEDVETEDLDLAVSLRRYCAEVGRPCRFVHVPDAIAWTDVPESLGELASQRERWVQGTTETVDRHRGVFGNPAYGRAGVLGLPYFLLGEVGWPMVEGLGYLVVPVAWLLGAIPIAVPIAFVVGLACAGPVASVLAILATRGHDEGYGAADRRTLLKITLAERFWRPVQVSVGSYSAVDYVLDR